MTILLILTTKMMGRTMAKEPEMAKMKLYLERQQKMMTDAISKQQNSFFT